MYFKFALVSLIAAFSVAVNAAPEAERRQIDSVFNSSTSAAASAVTGAGQSIFSEITSAGGNVASDITSVGGGAFDTVTSVGGQAVTVAGSAGSVVTSVGGSIITAATSAAGSVASQATHTNAAATAVPSFGFTSSHAIGLATIVCSALVGAIITL